MLDLFMTTETYYTMVESKVDEQPKFKALLREFDGALGKAKLSKDEYDEIDNAAIVLAYTARDMAYKAGFEDGVRFIMDCAGGRSNK